MEILTRLDENSFENLDHHVAEDVNMYKDAQKSTLLAENAIGKWRRKERQNMNGKCTPKSAYSGFLLGSLHKDFDRALPAATAAAKLAAPTKVSAELFDYCDDARAEESCPLDADILDSIHDPKLAWPNPSAENFKQTPLRWQCAVWCQGKYPDIADCWQRVCWLLHCR